MAWWQGPMVCAVCDHRQMVVVPISTIDGEPPTCECARCGSMSCVPIEEDDQVDEVG